MTFKEVRMVIDAFIDEKNRERQQLKVCLYNNAYLTSLFVGLILGGKKVPKINEIFMDDEQLITPKDAEIEDSMLADRMRDFARNANKQIKNREDKCQKF